MEKLLELLEQDCTMSIAQLAAAAGVTEAEAKAAIEVGKKLKKAKLSMTRANQVWSGTFDADQFAFGSFKLPEGESMNEDEIFSDRVLNLAIFRSAISAYFKKFADAMLGMEFPAFEKSIRDWARNRDAI